MALSPQEVERRLEQGKADVVGLYEMITDVQSTLDDHGVRLERLDTKVDQLDTKVDQLDTKVDEILLRLPAPPGA